MKVLLMKQRNAQTENWISANKNTLYKNTSPPPPWLLLKAPKPFAALWDQPVKQVFQMTEEAACEVNLFVKEYKDFFWPLPLIISYQSRFQAYQTTVKGNFFVESVTIKQSRS